MTSARLFLVPFLLVIALVSTGIAQAYENAKLAGDAAVYFREIVTKQGGQRNAKAANAAFAQAVKAQKARNWAAAVTGYEKAIARGRRDADTWFRLSNALASARPANRQKGLAAAFSGYRAARTQNDRALALWHVASHYENLTQYRKAVDAYEASLAANDNPRVRRRYARIVGRVKLVVRRVRADSESETPRVCVEFTKRLDKKSALRLGDFVALEPAVKTAVTARDRTLCIEGVVHGSTYQLTLRAGLPGADNLKLEKTARYSVVVADRKSTLSFRGNAFILPTKGRQGLPITSVNVGKARIEVMRINDRAIVEQINERRLLRLLTGYSAQELRNVKGEEVYKGTLTIASKRNKDVVTVIPVRDILKDRKPGIYVAVATPLDGKKERSWQNRATQWFVVTDLGLSTYMSPNGMHVAVRSLDSAEALEDVNVLLIARNNDELARVRTDENGIARFAPGMVRGRGGNRPAAIMAFAKGGEFVFIDLTRPAFDLTDRGVGGRATPGPVDAFVYTERGVYRPGETVHATALLRSAEGNAQADVPLVLKLFRPNGAEARRFRLAPKGTLGGRSVAIRMPASARTGRWTLAAYVDPKGKAVGRVRFQVEDFVPERLAVKLEAKAKAIVARTPTPVEVDAQFLYGAPGADLRASADLILRMNMNPFEQWKGYQFGLVQEEFRQRRISLKPTRTGADGKATFAVNLDALPDTTRPLAAVVRVSVLEAGGRATVRTIRLPVHGSGPMIGIKPGFSGSLQENKEGTFEIIAVTPDGKAAPAGNLTYELIREEYRYHWYYRSGRWNYRVTIEEGDTRKGTVSVGAQGPAKLGFKLGWGGYRLEVRDKASGAATSLRFRVGWWASAKSANTPDKLEVGLDKKRYNPGDTATVFVKPPFEGKVQLVIASDKVHAIREIDADTDGAKAEFKVERSWGPSVYVIASAFRPGTGTQRGPARAIGLAHLSMDMSARTLAVTIDGPAKIKPRRRVEIPVRVEGIERGGRAYVTLAAVDEGILQLTDFKTPKPAVHYFGKRRLGVELRDDYGRLINPGRAAFGTIRQGGDAAAKRHLSGLDASSVKTVALFSGVVKLDGEGRATISLDVPDFNGRLRLMAVAWDGSRVGSGEAALTVRDALVSTVTLPRFLAPRDVAAMTVSLHNLDGNAGDYKVSITGAGMTAVEGETSKTLALAKNQRQVITYRLRGMRVGVGKVTMKIAGPGGYGIERSWDLAVRPAQTVLTRRFVRRIQPGQTVRYERKMLAAFVPGTASVALSFATAPDLNLAGVLKSLDRYPYGCVEQTTSRALPLLYVADVAASIGIAEDKTALRAKVQRAVGRVLTMQRSDGAFGFWSALGSREEWVSAYVMDFLTQAKKKGYPVPEAAYERGLAWLGGRVADSDFRNWQLPARAYAFYVLASAGKAKVSDLRYFHDTYLKKMPTALALAQTGAALVAVGETDRAAQAFRAAFAVKERPRQTRVRRGYSDYGSNLRDKSGLVYLAALTKQGGTALPQAVLQLAELAKDDLYTSTQEKAWLLLAAHRLAGSAKSMALRVGTRTISDRRSVYMVRRAAALGTPFTASNAGKEPIWHSAMVTGVPKLDQPKTSRGFSIKRTFYTMDGKRADLKAVKQGTVLVAVISGEATTRLRHQALVVDLLPAGFEIENTRLRGRAGRGDLKWLPKLASTVHEEPRDDRWAAAVNFSAGKKRAFVLAYLVRAVTPGTFRLPAAYVEDMYKPRYFGRDVMGTVTVVPAR